MPLHRWLKRLRVESLEDKRMLAVVPFGPQQIIDDLDADGADRVFTADLDGDGDEDILVASYRDGRVTWFETQPDGQFTKHPIDRGVTQVRDALAADFDGDGDLDVAVAAYFDDRLQWYENLDGRGSFDKAQPITNETNGPYTLDAADLDGDGDVDLASGSWFDDKVAWYENDGTGQFAQQQVITTTADGPRGIRIGDINGDQRNDILVGSRLDDTLSWIPNLGNGNFGSPSNLGFTANGPESVDLGDVDGDGDLDAFVITYRDDTVAWFENLNGEGLFGSQNVVTTTAKHGQFVAVQDIDGDGDLDIVAASYDNYDNSNRVAWYANRDGLGDFGTEQIITQDASGVESFALADIDRDGAIDTVVASAIDNKVAYHRNLGDGSFARAQQVLADAGGVSSAQFADVDGDGDLDVVAASYWDNSITWYENLDARGSFGDERLVSDQAQRAQSVRPADLDGDGDLDLLSASYGDGKIAWYENIDGRGNFGEQQVLSRLSGAVHVHAADLDGDGDLDAISASSADAIVAWYENTDGQGTFGDIRILTRRAIGAEWVSSADLDGDGDLDILNASYQDGELTWFENLGNRTFSATKVLATGGGPTAMEAVDLDGDGDLDIAAARYDFSQLVWLENLGGVNFAAPVEIAGNLRQIEGMKIADIDGSGTPDVLVSGEQFVIWYEYVGGGSFEPRGVTGQVDRTFDVDAGDVNGDGTLDILSSSFFNSTIAFYVNGAKAGDFDGNGAINAVDVDLLCAALMNPDSADSQFDLTDDGTIDASDRDRMIEQVIGTSYGDANLDGVFSSSDLVAIFTIGEYEDETVGNSTWADGDWNCDGDFTTQDLVLAFQRGIYQG